MAAGRPPGYRLPSRPARTWSSLIAGNGAQDVAGASRISTTGVRRTPRFSSPLFHGHFAPGTIAIQTAASLEVEGSLGPADSERAAVVEREFPPVADRDERPSVWIVGRASS